MIFMYTHTQPTHLFFVFPFPTLTYKYSQEKKIRKKKNIQTH